LREREGVLFCSGPKGERKGRPQRRKGGRVLFPFPGKEGEKSGKDGGKEKGKERRGNFSPSYRL